MVTKMIASTVFGFIISLGLGIFVIPGLKRLKYGQNVRDDGPQSHLSKAGTPTMGGIIFLLGITGVWLLFETINMTMLVGVLFTWGFGIVGFVDDYIKVVKKRSLGLRAIEKLGFQVIFAAALAFYISWNMGTKIWVPFTHIYLELGWMFVPFVVFFVLSVVNGVNLTDGLDGLASGVSLVVCATYAIIFYHLTKSGIIPLQNANGMMVFAGGFCGCLLGFLRFNVYPAKVFMGDTGSLAIGGAISYLALMSNTALLIPIIGGCFVASVVSVIMQVLSYKLRNGKRVLKMAPLHHHFELCGIKETKVVSMYIIATVILCLIGLLSLV